MNRIFSKIWIFAAILSSIVTIVFLPFTIIGFTEGEGNPYAGSPIVLLPQLLLFIISGYFWTSYFKKKKGLGPVNLIEIGFIIIIVLFGVSPGIIAGFFIYYRFFREIIMKFYEIKAISLIGGYYGFILPYTVGFIGGFILFFIFSHSKRYFLTRYRYQTLLVIIFTVISIILPISVYNILSYRGEKLLQSIEVTNFKDSLIPAADDKFKKIIIEVDLIIPKDSDYSLSPMLHSFKKMPDGSLVQFDKYVESSGEVLFLGPDSMSFGNHDSFYQVGDKTYCADGIKRQDCNRNYPSSFQLSKGLHKMIFEISFQTVFNNPYKSPEEAMQWFEQWVPNRRLYFYLSIRKRDIVGLDDYEKSYTNITRYYTLDNYSQYFGAQKTQDETADWLTYRDEQYGFEFMYPKGVAKEYIGTQTWPPKIIVSSSDHNFICEELSQIKTSAGYGSQKEVRWNNSKYCATAVSEGAAGTFYTTYKYITEKDGKQLSLEFVLWSINCGGLPDDMGVKACEKEEKNFDPTELIDQIISTFRFLE